MDGKLYNGIWTLLVVDFPVVTQVLLQDWEPFDSWRKLQFAGEMDWSNFETDAAGAEHSSAAGSYFLLGGFFFKVLFLEQKPDGKYAFVFNLLGSSLDSIKDDPPIRQRDKPPWICLLLGLQGQSCTHPSGIALTQMYVKRKWLNSCINYSDWLCVVCCRMTSQCSVLPWQMELWETCCISHQLRTPVWY